MIKIERFIIFWGPCLVWMGAIFYFSAQPRFGITEKNLLDFILFKGLHMIEYGFLYYLLFRAISKTTRNPASHNLTIAVFVAIIYAITDEVHQSFVPTRDGKIRDIFIDMVGISLVWFFIKRNFKLVTQNLL